MHRAKRWLLGVAAALMLLAPALTPTQAQETPPPEEAMEAEPQLEETPSNRDTATAKVFIEFEGGIASNAMASVIRGFGIKSKLMPIQIYRPDQTIGLCPILESELKLPANNCTADLIGTIVWLNKRSGVQLDPNAINAKGGVALPAIRASINEITRIFDLSKPEDKNRIEQILNNPGWGDFVGHKVEDVLGSDQKNDPKIPRFDELVIKRIAWEFEVSGTERIAQATLIGRGLSNPNLLISVQNTAGFVKSKYSGYSALTHFQDWCGSSPVVAKEGNFADMVDRLYDTSSAVSCQPGSPLQANIVVMDQPIDPPPADLGRAFLEDSQTTDERLRLLGPACSKGAFDRNIDHSALLSTIIASSANGYGFVGMAPDATITSHPWNQKPDLNNELRLFIEKVWTKSQVFLLASKFAPYPPKSDQTPAEKKLANDTWKKDEQGNWVDLLKDNEVRRKEDIARTVLQIRSLLVVAAGQTLEGDTPFNIQAETPMSPQNLGDYDNILVVAACEKCDTPDAKLWPQSNRGTNDAKRSFVGVMAPGGEEIPSYVANGKIAMTQGGTSAASAFVAGLAAKMTQCYPDSYRFQPGVLKERIILASRPVLESSEHVSGGVIDPSVSMLDPNKTWLKLKSGQVRPVAFNRWCKEHLKLAKNQSGQVPDPWFLSRARRLTAVDGVGLVYQRSDVLPDEVYPARTVKREAPGKAAEQGPIAAVQYEGESAECAVSVGTLKDLFLSQDVTETGDCSTLPPCG